MIVGFGTAMTEADQATFLSRVPHLREGAEISFPQSGFAVIRLADHSAVAYKEVCDHLLDAYAVEWVTPYLRDGNIEQGILGSLFVKLKKNSDAEAMHALADQLNIRQLSKHQYMDRVWKWEVGKYAKHNVLDIAISLHQSGLFEYAEPNYLFNPETLTDDPYYDYQWQIENEGTAEQWYGEEGADMDLLDAWYYTTGDPNIKVAIMDSGVDTNHVDLQGKLLPGLDATEQGTKGYPNLDKTANAHGTACAGIVGAIADNDEGVVGICPDCSIIPVKVFYYIDTIGLEDVPFSTSEWFSNGYSWMWQVADADVASSSWGLTTVFLALLPGDPALVEDALLQANADGRNGLGIPLLFSSGNDNFESSIWPADRPYTISVTSSSMCDERKSFTSCDGETWWGANYGEALHIAAPGVKIPTLDISDFYGYAGGDVTLDFNGTSSACPNAAGVVALMLSQWPEMPYYLVLQVLTQEADKVGGYAYDSLGVYGNWSQELGYGRINAANAVFATFYEQTQFTGIENPAALPGDQAIHLQQIGEQLFYQLGAQQAAVQSMSLINVQGQQIAQKTLEEVESSQGQVPLKWLNALPAGVYFLRFDSENQSNISRFSWLR